MVTILPLCVRLSVYDIEGGEYLNLSNPRSVNRRKIIGGIPEVLKIKKYLILKDNQGLLYPRVKPAK